jgi:hypothetical protein
MSSVTIAGVVWFAADRATPTVDPIVMPCRKSSLALKESHSLHFCEACQPEQAPTSRDLRHRELDAQPHGNWTQHHGLRRIEIRRFYYGLNRARVMPNPSPHIPPMPTKAFPSFYDSHMTAALPPPDRAAICAGVRSEKAISFPRCENGFRTKSSAPILSQR